MTVAAGHERKHKAAMSKPGDVAVGMPISTEQRHVAIVLGQSCCLRLYTRVSIIAACLVSQLARA